MKRMIVTPAQLKAINEAAMNYGGMVNGNMSTPSEITSKASTFFAQNPTAETVEYKNTNSTGGASQMVSSDQTSQPGFAGAKSYVVDNPNMKESRKYSKRQVELGRMLEMRKTGKIYSKAKLNEMFLEGEFDEEEVSGLEETYDITEKIKGLPVFNVMTCLETAFGDDVFADALEAFSRGEKMSEYIAEIYNEADPEEQRIFRERLGI